VAFLIRREFGQYVSVVATNVTSNGAVALPPLRQRANYRPDIQGLRALAVVLVILDHAGVPGFEGGYIGVDVFFVISGYVITTLLHRQPGRQLGVNLRHFYSRRIRRIVPAATVVLIATLIAAYIAFGENMDSSLFGDVRWSALFAANFRFIQTSTPYFIPGVPPSLVTQFWSLAVEEQFYLVFPLLVFGLTYVSPPNRRTVTLATAISMGIILSAWWSYYQTPIHPTSAYYSPFTRFWELALGGLLALIPSHYAQRTPRVNRAAAVVAVLVIMVCVFTFNDQSAYPGTLAWWPCLAAAVLLWTGVASATGGPATWLAQRPATYVGDISYSLYLYHYAWLMLPLQLANPPTSWWAKWLEIAGATLCAVASYRWIENPFRRSRRLEKDFVSVVLLLCVCVAASWTATIVIGRIVNVT